VERVADPSQVGLAERAREGDSDAFWSLVEPYDRGLRALAYRLLGDRDLMDDALQEAYLKAFRALPSFRGDSAVASWLYRIVYNACLDQLRRAGRRRHAPLEAAGERSDPGPDPAEVATRRHDLGTALASLSPDMRAAVLLVDAEGMDYGEAAETLGIPRGTLASRLNRARAHLRRALGGGTEGVKER
jgi:RNA polymerase sigma-70 factor (ECF subfamily)